MPKDKLFVRAKEDTVENLEALQMKLNRCVEEGMVDSQDTYYNELLALIDEARLSKTWDELAEVITKAKTLEVDITVWFSFHGRTTIALLWPKKDDTRAV